MYSIITSGLQMPVTQNSSIWYNPQDYGATPGLVRDSSSAFLSMISQTGGAPAAVIISQPYLLSSPVPFPSNLQLYFPNGGMLKNDVGVNYQINSEIMAGPYSQIFDLSASGSGIVGAAKLRGVWPEWFGASSLNSSDDTVQTNLAAAFAHSCNNAPLLFNPGTYNFSGPLYGNGVDAGSFEYPSWIGMGKRKTIFNYSTSPAAFCVQFRGGSGQLSDATVEGIQFVGNAATYGLLFRGIGGMQARYCKFHTNLGACQMANVDPGSFTEYDVLVECEQTSGCANWIVMFRNGGNDSFNGSGSKDHLINASVNESIITVGAGCKPYNSPLSGQIWTNGGTVNLVNNQSTSPNSFLGDITHETRAADTLIIGGGIGAVRRTGDIVGTGVIQAGSSAQSKAVIINSDSSVTILGARCAYTGTVTTGANTLATNMSTLGRDIDIRFSASNYTYRYKLAVDHNGFGNAGYVRSTVGTTDGTAGGPFQPMEQINTAGYGAPTFAVDTSGRLVVTNNNWPAVGVSVWYEETETSSTIGTKQQA